MFSFFKNIFIFIALLLLLAALPTEIQSSDSIPMPQSVEGESLLLYFSTAPCDACAQARAEIGNLQSDYALLSGGVTAVRIESFSILEKPALRLLQACFDQWQVPDDKRHVPIVFYSGGYITSDFDTRLAEIIINGDALNFKPPASQGQQENTAIPVIAAAGFISGLNPCALSMFLFVIAIALERKSVGSTIFYVLGHGVAQFFICIFLFSLLAFLQGALYAGLMSVIKIIFIAAALALAAINILDFWNVRGEQYGKIRLQLPKRLRRFNHRLIEKLTQVKTAYWAVSIAGLGAVISAGELLCTGQVTLAALLYALESGAHTVEKLVIYIICLSTPMALLVVLAHFGQKLYDMTALARKIMPLAKLLNAALFLGFAVYFIINR